MSHTDKDKPRKYRDEKDKTNPKRHGGMMARNFAGYGGLKCPCCGVDNPGYKKVDRRKGKNDIAESLQDLE